MSAIFINYRRADNAAGYSRMLAQRLRAEFGHDQVFRDIKSIPPGQPFGEFIESRLAGCAVMLVLIGTQWTRVADASGRPRLADPEDWVRREIAAALARDTLVVPVLVCGAPLPAADELPDELKPLLERNAVSMSDDDFDHDLEQLVAALRKHLDVPAKAQHAAEPARAPTIADAVQAVLHRARADQQARQRERENPGFGRALLRKFSGGIKFAVFIAVVVWIGYTQSDPFAAAVDRFFSRSADMIRQLLS